LISGIHIDDSQWQLIMTAPPSARYEDGRDEAVKKAVFNQLMSYLTGHFGAY
jgi:hypothetical protein